MGLDAETLGRYSGRLNRLVGIGDIDLHLDEIAPNLGIDEIVDIFNRVNSGGTKLSKGDLALAKICAEWGQARPEMRAQLDRWQASGYQFSLDWLLRNVNAVATGRAPFSALEDVSATDFEASLTASVGHVGHFLELVGGRLGLDHDRVLMGRYAFPVISRLLHGGGGRFADGDEADRALYWYIHAALRGRFAGSTETVLTKDLETVEKSGMNGLITSLQRWRGGNLSIDAQDFESLGRGSRFYPLLYLLTRVRKSRDLDTGAVLGEGTAALEVHEIYPKAQLYKQGYARSAVNAIANFAFVGPVTAQKLGKRLPAEYFAECDAAALRSQWIPDDPALWELDRYPDFLVARRELLADAANEFLGELLAGQVPWGEVLAPVVLAAEDDESDARAVQIRALVAELIELGYATPALDVEIADPETGRPLAVAEAFWSDGLQIGQGNPVVLELDPEEADIPRLNELGCEVFTSVDALRGYALRRGEVASGDREDEIGVATPEPGEVVTADAPPAAGGEFDRAVLDIIDRCRNELRYNPKYFRVMITQHGALGAARKLLLAPSVSDGFVSLWEKQRLDLTVEALVVERRFAHLFTDDELSIARRRLDDFGYAVSSASA